MSNARLLMIGALGAMATWSPTRAYAQNPNEDRPPIRIAAESSSGSWGDRFARRLSGSIGVLQMRPVGEFRQYVGLSYGVAGDAMFRLDRRGVIALRTEIGWIDYGEESKRVPLSSTIGGRVQVDVKTTNQILVVGFGPQLTVPSGILRPYTGVTVGLTDFFTTSGVEGSDDEFDFANTTNHSTAKLAWTSNAGLYVPLRYGSTPVLLDLGVRYVASGRMSYLRKGGIIDLADNRIALNPTTSETRFLAYRIGIRVGQ